MATGDEAPAFRNAMNVIMPSWSSRFPKQRNAGGTFCAPPHAPAGVCPLAAAGPARAHGGFTLMELMVVIVIIGIMTALMIPEMKGSYGDAVLRSTSRELINVFELAYSRAVSLNQIRRVRLDESSGRYLVEKQVFVNGSEDFVPADDVPGNRGRLDPRITVEFHQPGEVAGETGAPAEAPAPGTISGQSIIAFYPDGTADGGAVVLRDRDGFQLRLQINPVTARVQIAATEREAQP